MDHSEHFEKVRYYYEHGNWSIERVRKAVGKWITPDEFVEITNQPYYS